MATKTFKIGLSNTDKQNMAQDVYERLLALTFPEYDTETSYEVGDFVVYNDQLYKCIGSTSGAWDSTKWQLATLNDLLTDIEDAVQFVNDKANVDGNYPTMTVGVADQLSPYDDESGDDQDEPFSFQATGTGNGTQPDFSTGAIALMKEKQGNTVVVNQLVTNPTFISTTGYSGYNSTISVSNNILTAEYSGTGYYGLSATVNGLKVGRKYLLLVDFYGGTRISCNIAGTDGIIADSLTPNTFKTIYNVFTSASPTSAVVFYSSDTTNTTQKYKNFNVIDLTQWFNGDIPQDLLDNPSNFYHYYQGSLAYNTGELVNANGRYIKCIGMNQWDEEWESGSIDGNGQNVASSTAIRSKNFNKCIPNARYRGVNTTLIYFYDKEENFISRTDFSVNNNLATAPSNATLFRVRIDTASYENNASINLYYEDEARCLTYEPYEVLTNNDTGTETLLFLDNKTPDGIIHHNSGELSITSSTNVGRAESGGVYYLYIGVSDCISPNLNDEIKPICNKYVANNVQLITTLPDKSIMYLATGHALIIRDDSITSPEAFHTAYDNVMKIQYELAEPTTEQGTPFSENLVIDDFGSMDFQGTNGVPQGNLIFYPVDYKAFIDTLYNYTDGTPSELALKSDLSDFLTQVDLSSGITAGDGITILKKKLYKIGNVCTLSLIAQNTSGGAINSWTALATIPSGGYDTTNNIKGICIINNNEIGGLNISTSGLVACMDKALSAGESIYVNITYAVA